MEIALARSQLQSLYSAHSNPFFTNQALGNFDRLVPYFGAERAYHEVLAHLYSRAALADYAELRFSADQRWLPGQTLEDYNASLPSDLVIGLLFPQAAAAVSEGLSAWIEAGWLSNHDLLYLRVSQPELPTDAAGLAQMLLDHPDIAFAGWQDLPDLGLPALAPEDVRWLLALYVAAFARAPEPAGLSYWAQQLVEARQGGGDPQKTLETLAGHIDWAGSQNHEAGTLLLPADYVAHVYRQGLGREAEPAGLAYWADALASGEVPRGQFLAVFLYSAQQSAGDADYLQARVTVAGHAVHALLQNPDASLDLAGLLQGVHDPASALAALASLPASPSGLPAMAATWGDVIPTGSNPGDASNVLPELLGATPAEGSAWADLLGLLDPTFPVIDPAAALPADPTQLPWQPPFPDLTESSW